MIADRKPCQTDCERRVAQSNLHSPRQPDYIALFGIKKCDIALFWGKNQEIVSLLSEVCHGPTPVDTYSFRTLRLCGE